MDRQVPLNEDTSWILTAGHPSERVWAMTQEAIETGYMDWIIVQIPVSVLLDV
jgi:hypothetical protein